MKSPVWFRIMAVTLAVSLSGCGTVAPYVESTVSATAETISEVASSMPVSTQETAAPATLPEAIPTDEMVEVSALNHKHNYAVSRVVDATCAESGYTEYACECGNTYKGAFTDKTEHAFEDTVIAPTSDENGYTLHFCTVCNFAYKDSYTEKIDPKALNTEQKRSIAMLNYLATLTQKINSSKHSRMFLEEAYASLINNTNPEGVIDDLTESHLVSLLDTIEKYRLINEKRTRLDYIYNQSKAVAIRKAVLNPISILSATSTFDPFRFVTSVAYMAVDSMSSYNAYNDELDQAFLKDGWDLDTEEEENLHQSRKSAFLYMLQIVREYNLPGELALNDSSVEKFVKMTTNNNIQQRLQFLESEEDTYRAFGTYWLACADCYYETSAYDKCLKAIDKYKMCQADIFRKDYYLAQIMPKAIASASKVYSPTDYISYAEECLKIIDRNTEQDDWVLHYYAAQVYMDMYVKTKDVKYLKHAYDLALNNITYLVDKQKLITTAYCEGVKEIAIPTAGNGKKVPVKKNPKTPEEIEAKQIDDYNKSLNAARKTELPSVYEPLLLNCEMLYALMERLNVPDSERVRVASILETDGTAVFLTKPLANRYTHSPSELHIVAEFEKTALKLPVYCVSNSSAIEVIVTSAGKTTVINDWKVKEVERKDSFESFTVTYTSEQAKKQKWSPDSIVEVQIHDEPESNYAPEILRFKVSKYRKIVVDFISFEQVN